MSSDSQLQPDSVIVDLPSGVCLEVDLWKPSHRPAQGNPACNKLAVCLHPWSWLGGRKEDPVLSSLLSPMLDGDYYVLQFNSRGVGRSTGWASLTGFKEAQDLEELVKWATQKIGNVVSLVILGYSHGSLIASLFPVIPGIKTSHVLLSYPLGPRAWLTLFNSSSYAKALEDLVHHDESNVLVIFGDSDEFTNFGPAIFQEQNLLQGRDKQDRYERPRQSVANLIGRFETQTKRLSLSASSPSRSSSVVSHITGDSAREEVKEKREWPPKSVTNVEKQPLPIVPPLSSRIPAALSTQIVDQTRNAPDEPEVPLTAKALNASQRQVQQEPNAFLENWRKDLPSSTTEMEPAAVAPAASDVEKLSSVATPTTASAQKFVSPATPRTLAAKTPTTKSAASKTSAPASSKAVVPAASRTPAKPAIKPSAPKLSSSVSTPQPLKPQHTGHSMASTTTAKKTVPKTPMTPRAKTPSQAASRSKTPTSVTRPKTPSTGLFAPTAASLARSRNAPVPVSTPVKKATLSSSAMDRLSKPTAASLSKRATPVTPASSYRPAAASPRVSTIKPRVPSTGSKAKKDSAVPKAATGAAVAATVATIGAAVAVLGVEEQVKEAGRPEESVENGHGADSTTESAGSVQDVAEEAHDAQQEEGEISVVSPGPEDNPNDDASGSSEDNEATPLSPSPAPAEEAAEEAITEDTTQEPIQERKDDLEDIVNLLESVSLKPAAPSDISDGILEIPDEDEK
ncbi:hypothetical protein NLJ89_g4874 [Agrocybe chaxingu]|uniref:Uncharacterized protein n=1 Tax=Agrocybe chaxingu TaxID=84603 RepID=A0A9W8MVJ3_9AGAR|nr:hypothetical protein NLJ89_g4874 [Agrocybe chaxingu]